MRCVAGLLNLATSGTVGHGASFLPSITYGGWEE